MKLRIAKTYRVLLFPDRPVAITLVGVGGTGSALALALGRLAYHARLKGISVSLTFVDPDHVEQRNIGRQFFAPAEIGYNKAEALAARLNAAFGLSILAIDQPFTADMVSHAPAWGNRAHQPLVLLVGAVDNAAARGELARGVETGRGQVWCLDCGNARFSGQVLIGNLTDLRQIKLSALGLCSGLPSPYVQAPDLLLPEAQPAEPSCADLVATEEQSLMVNQAVASYAMQYLYRFVILRELNAMATHFNLEPPTASSTLITRRVITRVKRAWQVCQAQQATHNDKVQPPTGQLK